MSNSLLFRISECIRSQPPMQLFEPPSPDVIAITESALGFSLPLFLKACYEQVGNGGFGPGYGLIGLDGGAKSDFGTIFETYRQLKTDQESEGNEWKIGMLPFCAWGCNIFSCVDCSDTDYKMYVFEDFELWPEEYSLENFFEMWLEGVDILSCGCSEEFKTEITNPFTGEKSSVAKRRRT